MLNQREMPADMSGRQKKGPSQKALTSIPKGIHYAATDELEPEAARREQDEIDITNFINALAEVAIAVARRRRQGNQ